MAKETVEQPSVDAQRLYDELLSAEPEVVSFGGRKARIGWLHKDTERRISHIMLKYDSDDVAKNIVKWYSAVALDRRSGFLTWLLTTFVWWAHWRWTWYVKRERGTQFQMGVVGASKKKLKERSEACALTTILMVEVMDTMMMKAAHEAGRAERVGAEVTP